MRRSQKDQVQGYGAASFSRAGRVGGSLESEAIKFSFHFSMLLGSAQLRSCQPLQCKVTENI